MKCLEQELAPKIKLHGRRALGLGAAKAGPGPAAARPAGAVPAAAARPAPARPIEIVCIGTSTGGPAALADVFAAIPRSFPVPIVIVQHMPVIFTRLLAERLTKIGSVEFFEGAEGQVIRPGCAYIAPGGRHMEVVRSGVQMTLHLQDGPPENSCRPAVDVLFRSVAAACGAHVVAAVLTGMGQDGLHGCRHLRERQARILAQDEATSVVWGMPGCIVEAALADRVLPLSEVAGEICRLAHANRPPSRLSER